MARSAVIRLLVSPVVREGGLTSGAAGFSTLLSAIASIIIARVLGAEGRGITTALLSLAILCGTFATLGVPSAAAYAIARTEAAGRPRLLRAILRLSAVLTVWAGVACLGFAVLVGPEATSTLAIGMTAVVAAAFVLRQILQQVVLTGVGIGAFATIQLAPSAFTLAVVVVLAETDRLDVTTTIAVSAASAVLGIAIALGILVHRRALGARAATGSAPAVATLRPYLGFAAILFVILSLGQVVQRIDILLVEGFLGARDAGLYAVAVQIGDLAMIVPAAIGIIVFRRGALSAEGHWDDAMRAITMTALAGIAIATVLGVAAPFVIDRVVGSDYLDSATPLRWLLPGLVLLGIQTVMSNYVVTRGHERMVLAAWFTAAIVGIAADIVLIPAAGITGAAIVSSVSYLIVMGMHVRALMQTRHGS